MSSNTGPAEIAELLQNEEKRNMWIVLTLQEIKTDLAQHVVEDKAQFAQLREGQHNVSSSVGGLEKVRHKVEGGWATIVVICAVLVVLVDIGFKIAEAIK